MNVGKPVTYIGLIQRATMAMTHLLTFNRQLDMTDPFVLATEELIENFEEIGWKQWTINLSTFLPEFPWLFRRDANKICRYWEQFVRFNLENFVKTKDDDPLTGKEKCWAHQLREFQYDKAKLSDGLEFNDILPLLVEFYEASAFVVAEKVAWILALLAVHQKVQDKLHVQILDQQFQISVSA